LLDLGGDFVEDFEDEEQLEGIPETIPGDLEILPPKKELDAKGSKKLIAILLKKKQILLITAASFLFFLFIIILIVIDSSGTNDFESYKGTEKCENVTVRYVPYNEQESSSTETMKLEEYVRSAVYQYVQNIRVPSVATGISEVYYSLAVALRTEVLNNSCTVTYRDKKLTKNVVADAIFDKNLELSEGVILTDTLGNLLPVKISDFCWNESLLNETDYKIYQANSMSVPISFATDYLSNSTYLNCACNKESGVSTGKCNEDACYTYWPMEGEEEEEDPSCYRAWLHQDDISGYSVFGAYYIMMVYGKDYNEILRYFFGDFRYRTIKELKKDEGNILADTNCSSFSLSTTTLSKEEFVSKVKNYNKSSSSSWKMFQENADIIYDLGIANHVNPEMIIVRPLIEGFSPGGSTYNYFGIGCTNENPHCKSYDSFELGILGFIELLNKNYPDYDYFIHHYAQLGRSWYNPGSSSSGGCYYAKYIYPSGLDDYVLDACGSNYSNCSGSSCAPVREEDKEAYAMYQNKIMLDKRADVFGISSNTCSNDTLNYGSCVLYKQGDARWKNEILGNGPSTIGSAGCALTSLTIALTCTGEVDDVDNFSPLVLNEQLKLSNGFNKDLIYWDNEAIRKYVPTFHLKQNYSVRKTDSNETKISILKNGIGSRVIGIVHIENTIHSRGHFVVLKSIDEKNNTILVLDPAFGDTYTYSLYDVDGFKTYVY